MFFASIDRRSQGSASPVARTAWLPYLAILLASLAVVGPAIFGPVRTNDSFWIDWVWLDQFASELAKGNFYPRWLPQSHGGLGSPVFYYYPPLAFYAGSAFVFAGLGTYAAMIATFFASFVLAGVGMYWWLKPQSRAPLLGALIFTIAPYHAYNLYTRGAIAETFATAILPFVMIGLRRLSTGERGGFAITASAYSALIASHLPLALLASIFLIGPYALVHIGKAPSRLVAAGTALVAGIGLAAIYLVPAIVLEPFRDTAKLWHVDVLQPSNWSFWDPKFRTWPNYVSILVIGAALAMPLAGLIARNRSRWALFSLLCVLLAIGTVPTIWSLPLLKSVQFPFRLLPIAEFALATGIAMAPTRPSERVVALLVLTAITIPIASANNQPVVPFEELRASYLDVPENLPPGERPYSWPSRWALQLAEAHRAPQQANGMTVMPTFYYPAWEVRCGDRAVPTFPDERTRLLSYKGSADCDSRLVWTAAEKIGAATSLLALAALLTGTVLSFSCRRAAAFKTAWSEG